MAKVTEETAVAITAQGAMSLADIDFGGDANHGFENQTSEDFGIPFLALLQDLSPTVKERRDGHIPGRFINSVTQELYGDSVTIVPCYTEQKFLEWVPRNKGGGLEGVYEPTDPYVDQIRASSPDKLKLTTPTGNHFNNTFYLYGIVLDADRNPVCPIMVSFDSTKIKTYKSMNTKLRTVKGNVPMYAFRLKFSSVDDRRNNNDFKSLEIEFDFDDPKVHDIKTAVNMPNTEAYKAGKEFYQSVVGGKVRVNHEASMGHDASGGDKGEAEDIV